MEDTFDYLPLISCLFVHVVEQVVVQVVSGTGPGLLVGDGVVSGLGCGTSELQRSS